MELGYSTLTRRERLERIATAERDRRAGRIEVAVAAVGEASEWPARAVLALASLPESGAAETRRILEQGLDLWAEEAGLAPLDEGPDVLQAAFEAGFDPSGDEADDEGRDETAGSALDQPIESNELEQAFAEAEAQTDEMIGANDVAEQILMNEPLGLAELDGEVAASAPDFVDSQPERIEMDAAMSDPAFDVSQRDRAADSADVESTNRSRVLATLERWLQNLEGRNAGRSQ